MTPEREMELRDLFEYESPVCEALDALDEALDALDEARARSAELEAALLRIERYQEDTLSREIARVALSPNVKP